MLRAIIIDDEARARDLLENSLKLYCPQVEVMEKCPDVPSAVKALNRYEVDVVFLDIEMPNYSGFELLDFVNEINFHIIFVTAYSHYAVRAFEVSAVDYLLKPLQVDRLEQAVQKAENQIGHQRKHLDVLRGNFESPKLQKIALPVNGDYQFLEINRIIVLEAERAYCRFHIRGEERPLVVSKSLNTFEEDLMSNGNFFRSHRSFLINLDYVASYNKADSVVTMSNGFGARLSRDRRQHFEMRKKSYR